MKSLKNNKEHKETTIKAALLTGKLLILIPIFSYIFLDSTFSGLSSASLIIGSSIIIIDKVAGLEPFFQKTSRYFKALNYRKILIGCLISLISFIFTISALEIIARISFRQPSKTDIASPLIQEEEFIEAKSEGDQLRQLNLELINWDEYHLMVNFDGKYVNVVNQQRVTTDQPQNYRHKIYIFGGSTMVGLEVGDQYTIPSYLQRMINEAYPDSYLVENMGVDAYNAKEQTYYLTHAVNLSSGDIVIFYDGVNDGAYTWFCCVGWNLEETLNRSDNSIIDKAIYKMIDFLEKHSVFYQKFIYTQNTTPFHLWSPKSRRAITEKIESDYYQSLLNANDFTTQHEAQFFHFLQPNIFSGQTNSLYEENLIPTFLPTGYGKSIEIGYDALNQALDRLEAEGVHNKDLTQILDPSTRPPDTEYFFDWCHVNHLAHEVIAASIFDEISPYLEE